LSLNNLGGLLQAQGDLIGARPYHEQALAIRRKTLGEQHPLTAQSLNNLGSLLYAQGDLREARFSFEQALAISKQMLGEQHPNVAVSIWWLGMILARSGDKEGARDHLQRALAIYTRALGEAHPTTRQCQRALVALDAPPQTREQQIAALRQQADVAVTSTLAGDDTQARVALAERLERGAQQIEPDSPYLDLAAHLRGLIARLRESDADDAS
jgi:tetratricopeptide (TPR) repeat protein